MLTNKTGKIMLMIFSALVIFLFTMCEDFEDETLKPNNTDAYAITAFKDTNIVDIETAKVVLDTNINKYVISYAGENDTTDASFPSVITTLESNNAKIEPGQTHYQTTVAKNRDNGLLISVSGTKEIIVYTTDHVAVEILDDTKQAMDVDETFSAELVAGHFDYDPDLAGDYPKPVIKTRSEFKLTGGDYMLNLKRTESTIESTVGLVVVEKQ